MSEGYWRPAPYFYPRHNGAFIAHYGRSIDDGAPGRGSGRYAKGSGKNPNQSLVRFRNYVEKERLAGKTDAQIRASMDHMSKNKFDARIKAANDAIGKSNALIAKKLWDDGEGLSKRSIGRTLGVSEGTVRKYLKDGYVEKRSAFSDLQDTLKSNVDKLGYIDVGKGIDTVLNCTGDQLNKAVAMLETKGYKLYNENLYVKQMTTGGNTELKVLAGPDSTKADVVRALKDARIRIPSLNPDADKAERGVVMDPDGNYISDTAFKPASVDSSRVFIKYAEEGGLDKDGLIELRRGVPDISLGQAHYAQVRIAVDDKLYLKGMAAHSDDIPEGYDIVFNTNKARGTALEDVLKPLKDDPTNPFGASIKPEKNLVKCQKYYEDPETGEKKLSAINVVNEEGDWDTWSKNLSSQFLGKQSVKLIKEQLGEAYKAKEQEYDEIMSIKNPTIRQLFLNDFADSCKKAQVNLKGAMLPGQATQVLLPVTTLKDIESKDPGGVVGTVYAPRYDDGQELVLVRFPHAHVSELPRVINDLSNPEAQKLIGKNTVEAIGVSPKIRQQLSGADTDGDTVVCIPEDPNNRRIETHKMLPELANFDPAIYARSKSETPTKDRSDWNKGRQMGSVSNLITDMTDAGATQPELIRAMKHSMVIIDAEKHNYDWEKSEQEYGIKELKARYQGSETGGASTILSRRKRTVQVDQRAKGEYVYDPILKRKVLITVDPETGAEKYRETGRTYEAGHYVKDAKGKFVRDENGKKIWQEEYDRNGNVKIKNKKTTVYLMNEVEDAFELTSGGSKEHPGSTRQAAYAENANAYKALERKARKESLSIEEYKQDETAKLQYARENASIKSWILEARKNKPFEKQAQILANKMYAQVKDDADTKDEESKQKNKVLSRAREIVGSKRVSIVLNKREVEAINANAITKSDITEMYKNSDKAKLKEAFMPRQPAISDSRISLARSYLKNGASYEQIAEQFGVSVSTLYKAVNK